MFDPHRIGPISESYYSRNKGRVIQRKLVPPINPPLTKYDLDRAYEVLKNNGRIPDYTIQDTIVNYPGGSSTKRIAYEIGSTIKVPPPPKRALMANECIYHKPAVARLRGALFLYKGVDR
ncbi:uncharacterized protein GO595_008225 [Histomonas meleagridis]|uniref:uncharacterized protein n=1 Tax=Histomonas meleagridis TaxID=135588 RepID=UPI003559776A|nr:hypothetical protein GO595_008225 [Histomonas meleagridis]